MTTKRICYTRPDGGVSVVVPAPTARLVSLLTLGGRAVPFDPPVPHYAAKRAAIPVFGRGADPVPKWAETESAFLARVAAKSVPADSKNIHVCDAAELPYRGNLRAAWRQTGKAAPVVDLTEARAIKMAAIRAERDKRLAGLDALSNRARDMDDQAELARVLAAKQALRGIPQTADLSGIADPAELDQFEPAWP